MNITKLGCAAFFLAAIVCRIDARNEPFSCCEVKETGCKEEPFRVGWYTGVSGGPNILCTSFEDHQKINAFTGYALGWEFGYRWRQGIRLEIEEVFRTNHIQSIRYLGSNIDAGGHVWSLSTLVNSVFEIPGFSQWWLTPYVGVGLGYARQNIDAKNFSLSYAGNKDGFAWQVIVGMGCWFHERSDFAFEYRYRQGPVTYLFDQTVQGAVKYHF